MSRFLCLGLLLLMPARARAADAPGAADATALGPGEGAPYFDSGPAAEARRHLRLEDWAGSARAFEAYVQREPKAADRRQAEFLGAWAASKAGRFLDAAERFDGLVARYPLLADYHRLYAARAYLQAKRLPLALERARAVAKDSALAPEARLAAADALRQMGRLAEAERDLREYVQAYPGAWREPEARFRLAEVIEGRGKAEKTRWQAEATALWRDLYVRFPTESWARQAQERLLALDKTGLRLRGQEHLTRGLALFDQMRNAESEAELRAALADGDLDASEQCVAAYHLAQSVFKARERPRAAPLFDEAVARCEPPKKGAAAAADDAASQRTADLHAKALYQGARCHAAKEEYGAAMRCFARLEAEHPAHSYADDARLREAELLDGLVARMGGDRVAASATVSASVIAPGAPPPGPTGERKLPRPDTPLEELAGWASALPKPPLDDRALADRIQVMRARRDDLLATIAQRYPAGDQGGEAFFRLGFEAFRRGALADARRWLETELAKYPREEGWWEAGRALYWLARVAQAQNRDAEAKELWTRAAREYPLGYYALAALNRLRERAPTEERKLVEALRTPAPTPQDLAWRFAASAPTRTAAFRRGVELARLGLGNEAKRELAAAGIRVPERRGAKPADAASEALLWLAAVLFDRAGEWSVSHAIPRYQLTAWSRAWPTGDNVRRWRLAYPRGYAELIVEHARRNGQPAALQFAIVREESAFSPTDESFANAIGLTQLTMAPAKRFAQGLPCTREALRDPVINVTIGARELGDVWRKAGGLAPLAIAAYNAGEGAVKRWLRSATPATALDEFIELIPYDETRGYTKRVLSSYFAYRWLYDEGDPVPPLPQQVPKT